jgi:hypothetical protein
MSEQTAEATATGTAATTEPTEPKPTETVDFWKQKAREQEKRAKENAAAATRLAEIEESQKSEAQKASDRIKQLETDAADARREALRFKVASKHGIDSEMADLLLTGADEAAMTKQAEAIKQQSDMRKKSGNRVPAEGKTTPQSGDDPMREFARGLFSKDD